MDLYREHILDHFKHPRNFGHLDGADAVSQENNISCGDRVTIELKLKSPKDKSKIIETIRFSGEGCAINQASASMLTEKVTGMKVSDIMKLNLSDIQRMLGTVLTPSRVKCALLPLEAIQKALMSVE